MTSTGFAYRPEFLKHETGLGHAERPERLEAIVTRLGQRGERAGLHSLEITPREWSWIEAVHPGAYVPEVRRVVERARGRGGAGTWSTSRRWSASCFRRPRRFVPISC